VVIDSVRRWTFRVSSASSLRDGFSWLRICGEISLYSVELRAPKAG